LIFSNVLVSKSVNLAGMPAVGEQSNKRQRRDVHGACAMFLGDRIRPRGLDIEGVDASKAIPPI
jgi:hypothetical protein